MKNLELAYSSDQIATMVSEGQQDLMATIAPDVLCGCGNCLNHAQALASTNGIAVPDKVQAREALNIPQPPLQPRIFSPENETLPPITYTEDDTSGQTRVLFQTLGGTMKSYVKPTDEQRNAFRRWEIGEKYGIDELPRREVDNMCAAWQPVDPALLPPPVIEYARIVPNGAVMIPAKIAQENAIPPLPVKAPPAASTVLFTYYNKNE